MEQVAADANPPVAQPGSVNGAHFALTDDLLAGRFFSIDVRGNVTGWNPRAEAAFGWSTHHVSGQSLFQKLVVSGLGFGPEQLEEFFTQATGGAGRRVRVLLAHQAGGQLPVELSIVPIQLAKAYELNAFLQDVSTSTASGVASEIGRVREEHAEVLGMIAGSLAQEPGTGSEESRLAGALIIFHIDAGAMTNVPAPSTGGESAEGGSAVAPPPVGTTAGEVETARAEAERVRAQIDEAHAAADAARAEAEDARRERDELQARIDAAAGEAGDAEKAALTAADEARKEAEQARADAEGSRTDAEQLRGEVEETRAEAERLRGELDGLRAAADGTQASAEAAAAELGEARAELSQAQSDLQRLGEELAGAQSQLEATQAELARANEERDALRAELAELQVKFEARGQAEHALVAAREQLEVAEKAVAASETELGAARDQRDTATADAQAAREETENARSEAEAARAEAETARSEAEAARAEAETARGEAEAARAEAETAEAELKTARSELDALRAEVDGLMAQAEAAGQTAGSAQEELGNARAEVVQARADAEKAAAEAAEAREAADAATKRAEQAEADAETARAEVADAPAADPTLEHVFDDAAIGMAIKADGRFARVNRALCELTGHDAGALLAIDPVELVHPDERKAHAQTEKALLKGDATGSQAEARLVHADGSDLHVRETASLLGQDKRILLQFEPAAAEAHTGVEEPPPAPAYEEPVAPTDQPEDENLPAPVETSTALAHADGLTDRIRNALAEDGFLLYAQPIIDLRTSEVTQYELLLRMSDESGRLMLPDKFLPAARHAGLMRAIDQWVVRHAIALIHAAASEGNRLMLEVNISPDSIDDPALPALIEAELDATGVDPRLLVIEVTEDAALDKIQETIKLSKWLRSMGCRFALDDFGSTFATVKYLKDLAVDYFKLDGDLIVTLPESRTNQLLLNALMDVARGTGTQTIAVYVPDDETLVMLRQYGIGYGQGNRVGRPRPVSEI